MYWVPTTAEAAFRRALVKLGGRSVQTGTHASLSITVTVPRLAYSAVSW